MLYFLNVLLLLRLHSLKLVLQWFISLYQDKKITEEKLEKYVTRVEVFNAMIAITS